ncbi:Outer envelope pore protein like [Actinidia chinensis var. chinensis]|uniref:Outer envelope pore protein like n=1 Tax=Actinidia chinensis var. chinensis TaxID=1590841 RepID=A0A2R6P476_ACTCC|nr:Outer envelope pore protein like [Actinidia chinensis var. chinensis]
MSRNRDMETRALLDELQSFDKGSLFDLGHSLLNRVAESLVKAAGVRDNGGFWWIATRDQQQQETSIPRPQRSRTLGKNLCSGDWLLEMYFGLTYGLKEARGTHDWKNSAVAEAFTGMALALALTPDDSSHEQTVQSAIIGAAIYCQPSCRDILRSADSTQPD